MDFDDSIIKNPIFLLGSHKSGTSLLRSLLDGSPGLFVVPIEMHFFKYMGYWVDYRLQSAWPQKLSMQEKRETLVQQVKKRNQNINPYSDSVLPNIFNVALFEEYLEHCTLGNSVETFSAYTSALYYSLTGNSSLTNMRVVEKSVENAEYAVVLSKMFPNAKFIHIVRNPYSTLVALRKSKMRDGYPFLGAIAQSLKNSYHNLYRNKLAINHYFIVKYEDLLKSTEDVMHEIANFLEVDFLEDLLKPTLLGNTWVGNSTSNQKFQNVSLTPLNQWKEDINNLEIHLVNQFLMPAVQEFGYEMLKPSHSYLFPSVSERPTSYIKNRFFLKTNSLK